MSDRDYINLDIEKKVVWLSFLEGEQIRQEKDMNDSMKKNKRGKRGR